MTNKQQNDINTINVLCIIEDLGLGGGAERLIVSLLPELRRLGVNVEIVTLLSWPQDIGSELESDGFIIHKLNMNNKWNVFSGVSHLSKIISEGSYSVIWGNLYFGNLYAMLCKYRFKAIRNVITIHSPGYNQLKGLGLKGRIYKIIEKTLGSISADSIVAVSNAVAVDYKLALGWKDISVIYNGVPVQNLNKQLSAEKSYLIRKNYNIDGNDFLIITPSRFVVNKGHAVLISTIKELKERYKVNVKAIFVGHGPILNNLNNMVLSCGLNEHVKFCDPMDQHDLFDLFLSSNAVVMPSLREPFGIAAAESMALGVPTILTKVDGFIELVGDSRGAIMVKPNDVNDLTNAILSVYNSDDEVKEVASNGKKRIIDNFDISIGAKNWASLFRDDS